MENLVKIDTSISESCKNMIRFLDSTDVESASETHKFIDMFVSVIFGSHDKKAWLFSCRSEDDCKYLYALLSVRGPLFRRVFRQAGNRQKEFQIVLDKLPHWIKRKIINCTEHAQLPPIFRDHLVILRQGKNVAENFLLKYDILEYFLWRFLFSPLLSQHQQLTVIEGDLYLKLFVEYFEFFLSKQNVLNFSQTSEDFSTSSDKGSKLFYSLKNPSLTFEAIHVKDYSKFVQKMELFLVSFIGEFWLSNATDQGNVSTSNLLTNMRNSSVDSLKNVSVYKSSSEILLACLQTFLEFLTDLPQDNPIKLHALKSLKTKLFLFVSSLFQQSLSIDSSCILISTWILMMEGLMKINPFYIDNDFAYFYILFENFLSWICSKSALFHCSNLEFVRKELKYVLFPVLSFYYESDLIKTLLLYEKILVDGERNKFESKEFSHEKYQNLKLGLSEYSCSLKISTVAFLGENTSNPHLITLIALVLRTKDFLNQNNRISSKEDYLSSINKLLRLISHLFSIDVASIQWNQIIRSESNSHVKQQPVHARPISRFNVVTDESIAKWSQQQQLKNTSNPNEIRVAVYFFKFIAFLLNYLTHSMMRLIRKVTRSPLKFLDKIPKWNLRRFAAWQWLITVPVWILLFKVFFAVTLKVKILMVSVFFIMVLIHRLFLYNKIILI